MHSVVKSYLEQKLDLQVTGYDLESHYQNRFPIVPLAIGPHFAESEPVPQSELSYIINSLPQPAPGSDEVTAGVIKRICNRHIDVLLLIVNY